MSYVLVPEGGFHIEFEVSLHQCMNDKNGEICGKQKLSKKKFKKLYSYTLQLHLLKDEIVEQASNAPMPPHSPTPLQY